MVNSNTFLIIIVSTPLLQLLLLLQLPRVGRSNRDVRCAFPSIGAALPTISSLLSCRAMIMAKICHNRLLGRSGCVPNLQAYARVLRCKSGPCSAA